MELADALLLSDGGAGGERVAMATQMARRGPGPGAFTFDIVPVKQVVRVTVEARFRMASPDLATIDVDRTT